MKKEFTIFVTVLIMVSGHLNAQSDVKVQSVYIFNFARLITWPEAYQSGNFIIGVIGNSEIVKELELLESNKKVGGRNIELKVFTNIDQINNCHILYLPMEQTKLVQSAVVKAKELGNNTLVICENGDGIIHGAAINFVFKDGKQCFELSKKNTEAFGLTIGMEIQRMAILVD